MPRSTANAASLLVRLPYVEDSVIDNMNSLSRDTNSALPLTWRMNRIPLPTSTNSKRTTFIDPLDVHDGDLQLRRVRRLQLAAERATNLGDADRADAVVRKAKNVV
jgi:hypothetical protein